MGSIRGTTQVVGLLGWPVHHSLSPLMQGAAFEAAGLDWVYVALPTPPERLGEAVRGLRAMGFRGANVTIPHKEHVIEFLDEVDPAARAMGAVNTIRVEEDGRLAGFNTDGDGAFEAIERKTGFSPQGRRMALIGAGGAARALAFGALRRGIHSIAILNQRVDFYRAEALAADLRRAAEELNRRAKESSRSGAKTLEFCAMPPDAPEAAAAVQEADLTAQATSLGMKPGDPLPIPPDWIREGAVVFDVVYSAARLDTPFLEACATRRGCRTVGGLGMLLFQGVKAFRIWTGQDPDVAVMERALRNALEKSDG